MVYENSFKDIKMVHLLCSQPYFSININLFWSQGFVSDWPEDLRPEGMYDGTGNEWSTVNQGLLSDTLE